MKNWMKVLLLAGASLALTFVCFNLAFGTFKQWETYHWILYLFVTMVVVDVLDYWVKRG